MVSCDISKNMSDNFLDMLVFVRVVQAGSLSGAARELNFSLTVISRKLSDRHIIALLHFQGNAIPKHLLKHLLGTCISDQIRAEQM